MPYLSEMFNESGLSPHGFCLLWEPGLIWLHLVSDTITGVSYYAIPVALAYFVWKRPDIDFGWLFWMFAGFILACGTTHFLDVWTLWHPDYGVQGVVKAITAALSLMTAAMLWPLVPRLLKLPSRALLHQANEQLSSQVQQTHEALERLRETEERHRLLVESVAYFSIVMLDRQGYVTDWSLGTERLSGYTTLEIVGKHISIMYPPEDRECGLPSRALEIAAREGRYEAEGWHVRKDGIRFWANVIVHPVLDNEDQFVGFFKVTRDITARREQEEELQRVRAALAQSQKMEAVGQLTGGIAHDFNNLLTAVLGNIELIEQDGQKDENNERFRRLAGGIRRAAERGAAMTERLLAFSRRQALRPQNTDMNQLVTGTSELLRSTLGEHIVIKVALATGLWRVFVDVNQLENAIINLSINARDAMPSGGTLKFETRNAFFGQISASRSEIAPGQYVVLTVSDTGEGMSAETAARAFEPFFTTKPIGEGTGLGLSQVYGFVGQSNGHIALNSKVGSGTTVTIYFPRVVETEETAYRTSVMAGLASVDATVLVVEDDSDVREYAVSSLTRLGYRVLEAGDTPTALSAMACHSAVDLLLTDIGLPGFNGRQLAEEASRRCPEIKVVYISGYARHAFGQDGVYERGVELLSKPFTIDSLGQKVAQMFLQHPPSSAVASGIH
jgi:PAS domain S-box-containing protein